MPRANWPAGWHWDWPEKLARVEGFLAYKGYSVACNDTTQGLMSINLTSEAKLDSQKQKPLVYVDYLEVAPWNRSDLVPVARFKGVGAALVSAAVELSVDEEFQGRVGLHSLPKSEGFYRNHCGFTDLGPDAAYQNLTYFEATPAQAAAFLDGES